MVAWVLLPDNQETAPPHSPYHIIDTVYETDLLPSENGHCVKGSCREPIYRLFGKRSGNIFSPGCLACGARYKRTPPELFLPLLGIDD